MILCQELEDDAVLEYIHWWHRTKSFTSLFAEEMAADGIRSDKGLSGLGKTVAFFLKYFNNAVNFR